MLLKLYVWPVLWHGQRGREYSPQRGQTHIEAQSLVHFIAQVDFGELSLRKGTQKHGGYTYDGKEVTG